MLGTASMKQIGISFSGPAPTGVHGNVAIGSYLSDIREVVLFFMKSSTQVK